MLVCLYGHNYSGSKSVRSKVVWDFGWTQIQGRRATNSNLSNSYSLRSNWLLSSIELTLVFDRIDFCRSKRPSIETTCDRTDLYSLQILHPPQPSVSRPARLPWIIKCKRVRFTPPQPPVSRPDSEPWICYKYSSNTPSKNWSPP